MKCIKLFYSESPLKDKRFQVRGLGIRELMPPGFVNRPRGTGDYLMMYFHTPAVLDETEEVSANSFRVWAPGEHQFYGRRGREFSHSWLHCDGDSVSRAYAALGLKGAVMQMPSPKSFLGFLHGLYDEISCNGAPDDVIAGNLLTNWTRDLSRQMSGRVQPMPERLSVVRDYIGENYAEPLTLIQLARVANWSPAHFSEEFRRHLGESPINYVIRARMQHAKYLLRDVNLSIGEVGARVGYENLYHFSKIFKQRLGISPRSFRNSHGLGMLPI